MTPNPTPITEPVATTTAAGVTLVSASQDELVKIIGKYRVRITRPKCIGAASCMAIAPDIFVLDEETIAKFVESDNPSTSELLLAAQSCPTAAIEIIDQESGQKIWPLG